MAAYITVRVYWNLL